jgi:hypothetical protein
MTAESGSIERDLFLYFNVHSRYSLEGSYEGIKPEYPVTIYDESEVLMF